ncbi:hypothetical protein Bca52824_012504 [Brassica carinata]|uniref:Uncharacterized protein n=1 Tax=Brassica carinata TaxID=52824 RepID=A0A8X7VX48_BRACI|nr:hypothetical protein Bca52824_012504 [Brassica carinata]
MEQTTFYIGQYSHCLLLDDVGNRLHCADEAAHCPYPKRGRVDTHLKSLHVFLKLGNPKCTNLSGSLCIFFFKLTGFSPSVILGTTNTFPLSLLV